MFDSALNSRMRIERCHRTGVQSSNSHLWKNESKGKWDVLIPVV
jgi:hypothetical protein